MNINVTFIFRKKEPQFNSIEEVFRSIISQLKEKIDTRVIELLHQGANSKAVFRNLKYASQFRNSIVHITGHVNYVALVLGNKSILTIHDLGSAFNRNKISGFIIMFFWFWIPCFFVKRITVISEFSKNELIKLVPFFKNKISVIPNAVSREFQFVSKGFNAENPRILHVGTKDNKNLERTIMALKGLTCNLVIIGKLTDSQFDLLEKSELEYINKFDIPFSEVIQSYIDCDMLSFVSTYEGFGMPIIEAQAAGRPVVTSNIGAMKEVAGNSACLVDPYDVTSIKAGFEKIINDEIFRADLISKGLKNVDRFRVEQIAEQYLKVYRDLANG